MSYDVRLDVEEGLLYIVLSGSVTGGEIFEALEELPSLPALERGIDVVFDGRNITELIVDPEDTRAISAFAREHDAHVPGRTAVIVRRSLDELMFQYLVDLARGTPRERRIVATVEEAEEWLGRKLKLNRL